MSNQWKLGRMKEPASDYCWSKYVWWVRQSEANSKINKLKKELAEARKQWRMSSCFQDERDRLAEALLKIAEGSSCCACRGSVELVSIADKALAAVKGGSDE